MSFCLMEQQREKNKEKVEKQPREQDHNLRVISSSRQKPPLPSLAGSKVNLNHLYLLCNSTGTCE